MYVCINLFLFKGEVSIVWLTYKMCDIIVNEFEFRSHYYFHFQMYTVEKGMNIFSLLAFYKDDFSIE